MAINFEELGLQLTEEQEKALSSEINKEIDRERTKASQSAHKNANDDWEKKLPDLIAKAVAEQTSNATLTAEQKAQQQYQQQLNTLQANYEALKASHVVSENKNKIRACGINDDATVDAISSMFVQNPEGIDSFLSVYKNSVDAGVKAAMTQQMNNATPPGSSNSSGSNVAGKLTQDAISQMIADNAKLNGGIVDDEQIFANLRAAQTSIF